MRPKNFDRLIGQEQLSKQAWFIHAIEKHDIPSIIFFGPPGIGKTSLALLIAENTGIPYKIFSAVTSTIKEVKEFIQSVYEEFKKTGKKTIVFIDEIHRFNKAQQDAFLPWIEKGVIILLGTTTENPSFYINPPLLSRVLVVPLKVLSKEAISKILKLALQEDAYLKSKNIDLTDNIIDIIAEYGKGDARIALNALELVIDNYRLGLSENDILKILSQTMIPYDKKGDYHYNLISAFIKSMRGSDPDAAVYYLARILESGEDPYFLLRRMIIFASEDIGNADPHAIMVATSAHYAFHVIGMPEGFIPLSQAAVYLSLAPKSNASYMTYLNAREDVIKHGHLTPPLTILNPVTSQMKKMGYGKGYKYPHDFPGGIVKNFQYLPDLLKDRVYYHPKNIGYEKILLERLKNLKGKK